MIHNNGLSRPFSLKNETQAQVHNIRGNHG
jgi:hypothetical protein